MKCEYENALNKSVGSKLILHTPKINDKNQKIDLEILFGLTHRSWIQYPQILQKYYFNWSINIFQSLIDYIKFSTEAQWRLVKAVCKICRKYTKGKIVRLHQHRVTKWHYATVEKKENSAWKVNAKLWIQFMNVMSLHQNHKKSTLGWQRENETKGIITIKSHSIINDIHTRQHFQVMCGIWSKL